MPLDAPYQVAPLQPGSNGSWSAPSYDVEPGVAVFAGRRLAEDRRARPELDPVADSDSVPAGPDAAPGRPIRGNHGGRTRT
ncbi:MAG TPA: hypothetical protein VHM48_07075, partial [Candidatus Limnocylindrales bacterium]|nr:hypothetical protein [Candidatus Limnocylindrales bacterium]